VVKGFKKHANLSWFSTGTPGGKTCNICKHYRGLWEKLSDRFRLEYCKNVMAMRKNVTAIAVAKIVG
jgi:hypothetical protein